MALQGERFSYDVFYVLIGFADSLPSKQSALPPPRETVALGMRREDQVLPFPKQLSVLGNKGGRRGVVRISIIQGRKLRLRKVKDCLRSYS